MRMIEHTEALRAYLAKRMQHYNVPGVSIGVARPGEPQLFVGAGVTNMNAPVPVDEHTLFQIGSTTKTFTALACVILFDRGLLDLDTPLVELCPDFRLPDAAATGAVTVRMLLNHTGGWDGDILLVEPVGGRNDDALARLPAYMEGIAEQLTAPGSLFHYNNTGFSLAGRVIEVVSGRSYEDFVREEIFEPLQMMESVFFAEEAITRPVAAGHNIHRRVESGWTLPRVSFPAGQITSSAADMLIYGRFMLGDGAPLLSSEAMHMLLTPTVDVGGAQGGSHSCGLSWFLRGGNGGADAADEHDLRICHGGATNGQLSGFALHRAGSESLVINVMTNGAKGRALADEVEDWVVERMIGEVPKPQPLELPLPFSLMDYVGVYANERSLSTVIVTADEEAGTLTLTTEPNARVRDWHTADADDEEIKQDEPWPPPTVVRMIGRDHAQQGIQFFRGEAATAGGEEHVVWLRNMRLLRKQKVGARL